MNCKPGDLALVIKDDVDLKLAGKLVEVLHLAPTDHYFRLPDGHSHCPAEEANAWLVRFSHAVRVPIDRPGGYRMASYGCIPDRYLRPLPGEPITANSDSEAVV